MDQTEIIFVIEDSVEGGYEARALGYGIYTQADSLDELKTMVRDAVRCHFDEGTGPRLIRLHQVKQEVILA
ncbi:MAG: 2-oxoisovalerate dehydrogenase [Chloroflexi bacterium]|nr:2-oxoisovalerate dehydrogenase [Chloroflexota bacterium]